MGNGERDNALATKHTSCAASEKILREAGWHEVRPGEWAAFSSALERGDVGGHPIYREVLSERIALHVEKSSGYGTGSDPFANFTAVAQMTGQPRYLYPVHRTIEKLTRVLSLHAQGRVDELEEEFKDCASLLDCCTAMLREDKHVG